MKTSGTQSVPSQPTQLQNNSYMQRNAYVFNLCDDYND